MHCYKESASVLLDVNEILFTFDALNTRSHIVTASVAESAERRSCRRRGFIHDALIPNKLWSYRLPKIRMVVGWYLCSETPLVMLKRRKTDIDTARALCSLVTPDIHIKDEDETATMIVGVPVEGNPYVLMADDIAKTMLSDLISPTGDPGCTGVALSFWKTIEQVCKSEQNRKEEIQISGHHIHIKYRKTIANDQPAVVVTAKKRRGRGSPQVAYLQNLPNEVTSLIDVVEEDIICKLLGMNQLSITMVDYPRRGVHRILTANSNVARIFNVAHPRELRGIPSDELGTPAEDSNIITDSFYANMNPFTKMSTFSLHLKQFPTTSFFLAMREIVPGINLCLAILYELKKKPFGPSPSTTTLLSGKHVWKRNAWDEVLENCLRYVSQNPRHASPCRRILPAKFLEDTQNVYCYAYQGEGNSDGYSWRSSRGVVSTATDLKKKYHYVDLPNNKKLRRRVMWLEEIKGLCMVEYRHSENVSTESEKLMGPDCMEWPKLLQEVDSVNKKLTESFDRINTHFQMAEARTEEADIGSENVVSYVNGILSSWASDYARILRLSHFIEPFLQRKYLLSSNLGFRGMSSVQKKSIGYLGGFVCVLDPSQLGSPYHYIPHAWIGIVFVALFGISTLAHLVQVSYYRGWWLHVLTIGGIGECIGWGARLYNAYEPTNGNGFLCQIAVLVIAPVFYSAAIYLMLGKVMSLTNPEYSRLRPKLYSIVFITCDVIALVVQAIGGGMAATAIDLEGADLGARIMLGGIVFQLVSMTLFVIFAVDFSIKLLAAMKAGACDSSPQQKRDLKRIAVPVIISSIALYVRGVYRVIELSEGWNGPIISTESYFVILDGLMMVIAQGVFNIVHPARTLRELADHSTEVTKLQPNMSEA
ncbi:RTA1 domain protein [Planoprotostelium fungivorum]|uniref:RTA1 domain protein n=1 Tax=Planoprotostelium fungivorum TaxID=1890364 RepID=A0A2P6N508_9EUKA|nr:RTA1 domain protein [Planoprotostelium fungivorum]